jgi:hypothetical protein
MRDFERYSAYAQLLEDVFRVFQVEIATAGPTAQGPWIGPFGAGW